MDEVYSGRVDALEQTWRVWAEIGEGLSENLWSTASRCPGWTVAALYTHHSAFPRDMSAALPLSDAVGDPVSAAVLLRRFNTPDGVAHTMAQTIADQVVVDAAEHTRRELIDHFSVHGPRALQRLRHADAMLVVPWHTTGAVIMLGEALRIVLLEATVHLLDVQRALGCPPAVPPQALKDTAQLLAELAPAVEFIEAATGRSTHSPLPVLR
jgi:uncharacterized protein (TIGR03083 family)